MNAPHPAGLDNPSDFEPLGPSLEDPPTDAEPNRCRSMRSFGEFSVRCYDRMNHPLSRHRGRHAGETLEWEDGDSGVFLAPEPPLPGSTLDIEVGYRDRDGQMRRLRVASRPAAPAPAEQSEACRLREERDRAIIDLEAMKVRLDLVTAQRDAARKLVGELGQLATAMREIAASTPDDLVEVAAAVAP